MENTKNLVTLETTTFVRGDGVTVLGACMAKGTNTRVQKHDQHCMVLANAHKTRERKKYFLLPFLAQAAYGCTNEGGSKLPGLSFPPYSLASSRTAWFPLHAAMMSVTWIGKAYLDLYRKATLLMA